jgi:glycerol-3-phosphate dehydrogenase
MAMTPDDVLARRTRITIEDRHRGLGILDDVVGLMTKELGWSPEQQQLMSDAFRSDMQWQLAAEKENVVGPLSIRPQKGHMTP